MLKQQLAHEREARQATEEKNRDLITMYHEISLASTQLGIEIGKGMQEQGKARQLGRDSEPGSNRSESIVRTVPVTSVEFPPKSEADTPAPRNGDNPDPGFEGHTIQ